MRADMSDKYSQEFVDVDEKVSKLLTFITEFSKLTNKMTLNFTELDLCESLESLRDDSIYDTNSIDVNLIYSNEENDTDNIRFLNIKFPSDEACPKPNILFKEWLNPGWEDYRTKEVTVKESLEPSDKDACNDINFSSKNDNEIYTWSVNKGKNIANQDNIHDSVDVNLFTSNQKRVQAYEDWKLERIEWCIRKEKIENTKKLYRKLYNLYYELERESENKELIIANGILFDKDSNIEIPILTKRVAIKFDINSNEIYIEDTESKCQIELDVFNRLNNQDDIQMGAFSKIQKDLDDNAFHPFDCNETPQFLKQLVSQISTKISFKDSKAEGNSDSKMLYIGHYIILRKRVAGTVKFLKQVKERIESIGDYPLSIKDIVCSFGKDDVLEEYKHEGIEDKLASVGGESVEILLSKEANKEQLEIAKRIERFNAVVVQGPPGTGKTHTIANLLGHFLAQGKSVLITSKKSKALKVLKNKIHPSLQKLCVSVLDDSNSDMEQSIDFINEIIGTTNPTELNREIEDLSIQRNKVIKELWQTRKTMFQIINREKDNKSIIYQGDGYSATQLAKWLSEKEEKLNYIPGEIKSEELPLSYEELRKLYLSNDEINPSEEFELDNNLCNPKDLLSPDNFEATLCEIEDIQSTLDIDEYTLDCLDCILETAENVKLANEETCLFIKTPYCSKEIKVTHNEDVEQLKFFIRDKDYFLVDIIIDSKRGYNYQQKWHELIKSIEDINNLFDQYVYEFEQYHVEINDSETNSKEVCISVNKIKEELKNKGKIGVLFKWLNKSVYQLYEKISINGRKIESVKECDVVINKLQFDQYYEKLSKDWDKLFSNCDIPKFTELDSSNAHGHAKRYIERIKANLDWYKIEEQFVLTLNKLGLELSDIVSIKSEGTDKEQIMPILEFIEGNLSLLCDMLETAIKVNDNKQLLINKQQKLYDNKNHLSKFAGYSALCHELYEANDNNDKELYRKSYCELEKVFNKKSILKFRKECLDKLSNIAPQWGEAIRKRVDIHGRSEVPLDIFEAFKWKYLDTKLAEINGEEYSDLQIKSRELSKNYHELTAKYAEKQALFYVIQKNGNDKDIRNNLNGWKQTVKKIGKGTGKYAPKLKNEARKLMIKCQRAVPSWVMTIDKALEYFDPKNNIFDVLIVDEASQADLSCLSVLFLGKKQIIVGDDKQVSPENIIDDKKIENLRNMYLRDSKGNELIPCVHLLGADSSLYDIASRSYPTLMLREHFRCVPAIIGFSNSLFYDDKIEPLRAVEKSNIITPLVNYRVEDGREENKVNVNEAQTIVALLKACIEQEEYTGKTFGVISLFEDKQVSLIQTELTKNITPQVISEREILCGTSANFQGDERDVIFLSMVHSAKEEGPIRLQREGTRDRYYKRYNVAVSRARDQLWLVNSLDETKDLKEGDIRKRLIDYIKDYGTKEQKLREIKVKTESKFEELVAKKLVEKGYNLEYQHELGAYRLDMVARYNDERIAIECDGDAYHSTEEQIKNDMERQTILERVGWKFIRIRGSDFFYNENKTIERVIEQLTNNGIYPENAEQDKSIYNTDKIELLNRVKQRASLILNEMRGDVKQETIVAALSENI